MRKFLLQAALVLLAASPAAAKGFSSWVGQPRYSSFARYLWWYRRTPYWDETVGLVPVFRVMGSPKLDTRPWK